MASQGESTLKWISFVDNLSVGKQSDLRTLAIKLDKEINQECATAALTTARPDNVGDISEVVSEVFKAWRGAVNDDDDKALEIAQKAFIAAKMPAVYRKAMKAAELDLPAETSTTESSRQSQKLQEASPSEPKVKEHERPSGQPQKPQEAAPTQPKLSKQERSVGAGNGDTTSSGSHKLGTYEIKGKLGKALIIKNKVPYTREGKTVDVAENDVKTITETLSTIGIDKEDPVVDESLDKIKERVKKFVDKASDYSYVCCFVTSHGGNTYSIEVPEEGKPPKRVEIPKAFNGQSYIRAKGGNLTLTELKSIFTTCEKLRGIPKLFFINSCRGKEFDRTLGPNLAQPITEETKIDPIESDVFIFHATPLDYYAWFAPDGSGSYFINILCDVLRSNFQTSDLMEIGTIVNEVLAQEIKKIENDTTFAQMSVMESTLRQRFYFIEESKRHK